MNAGESVARATLLIITITVITRLLGLGREIAIAYQFGASADTDAFFVAFIIPYAFYSVIGMALSTVIVPIFTGYMVKGNLKEAWRITNVAVNFILLFVTCISISGFFFSSQIVSVLGSGFPVDTQNTASDLTAIMMPSILFMALAGLLGGILHSNNIFGPPAFGPALMNIAIIGATFISLNHGIYTLSFGTLIGAILFLAVQFPALRHIGYKYRLCVDYKDPAIYRLLKLSFPVILTSGIASMYLMIDVHLASGMAEGSIASLNFANKVMRLPYGLFVSAFSLSLFPTLSKLVATNDYNKLTATLSKGLKIILFITVPCAVGLIVLREPIIMLLFERGEFDAHASEMTSIALLYYSSAIIGFSLNTLISRGFFAMQNVLTPLIVTSSTVILKYIIALVLINHLQHAGLALSTTITVFINVIILSFILQKRLKGLFDMSFVSFTLRVFGSSIVMAVVVIYFSSLLDTALISGLIQLIFKVGLNLAIGIAVYSIMTLVLRLKEFRDVIEQIYTLFNDRFKQKRKV